MLLFFYFVSATAYHIKSSSVFEVVYCLFVYLFVFSCVYSFWSIQKPE